MEAAAKTLILIHVRGRSYSNSSGVWLKVGGLPPGRKKGRNLVKKVIVITKYYDMDSKLLSK